MLLYLGWSKAEGLITENPIGRIKNAPVRRRERVITAAEREQILAAIRDPSFRRFFRALIGTGFRPSEVAAVTAADVNLEMGVWILQQHKTARKTGKSRIVYLPPEMLEQTREQIALHPTGPIFRNMRGKQFVRNAWRCRFRRLRAKYPNLEGIVAYSARHSYATDALVKGVGIAQVATLLGHSDTSMVASTYSHIAANVVHMREAAAKSFRLSTGAKAKRSQRKRFANDTGFHVAQMRTALATAYEVRSLLIPNPIEPHPVTIDLSKFYK